MRLGRLLPSPPDLRGWGRGYSGLTDLTCQFRRMGIFVLADFTCQFPLMCFEYGAVG